MKLKKISALGAGLAMAAAANAAAISFDDVPIRGNWEFSYTDYSVYGGEDVYEWSPSPSGSVESWQAMPANVGRFEWNSAVDGISGGLQFKTTSYNYEYYNGGGFLLSNSSDTSNISYSNDLCSVTGTGAGGSQQYAVFYGNVSDSNGVASKTAYKGTEYFSTVPETCQLVFDDIVSVSSVDIANTLVGAKILGNPDSSMNMGYTESEDGLIVYDSVYNTDDAFFAVLIRGIYADGTLTETDEAVCYVLASHGFLSEEWNTVDLSSLSADGLIGLDFQILSSFGNAWGMTSPAYFALDNIVYGAVPEPAAVSALFGMLALSTALRNRNISSRK